MVYRPNRQPRLQLDGAQQPRLKLRGAQGLLHVFVMTFAIGLLLLQLGLGVVVAFADSSWLGSRSLAAALFPISVAIYINFLARVRIPVNNSYAPVINNYIIFLLWSVMVFGIDSSYNTFAFPLREILYSCTIAFLIFRYKRQESLKDVLACCYGILSGVLAAILLFGWNPFAI